MLWFSKDKQLEKLGMEIERLTREVSGLRGEKTAITEQRTLEEKIIALKKVVSELEITRDKKQEDFDRRERELTHMIGLEKKRQDVEIKQASESARLDVREENLKGERAQFEKQMKFREDQFGEQVKYLQSLMKQILERLPTITIDHNIEEKRK
jgi:hypothetical protein